MSRRFEMSRFVEYFRMSIQSLRRRKLRSWLTMIGIFIGIAAVVSLISLGQGMQQAIQGEFEAIGSDKLFIQPQSSFGVIGDNVAAPLTEDDVDFIRRQPGVYAAAGYTMASVKVEFQGTVRYFSAAGIGTSQDDIELYTSSLFDTIQYGSFFDPGDRTTVVLGIHHYNQGLYAGEDTDIGNKLIINGQPFRIKGYLAPEGNNNDDRFIIMPLDTFREVTNITERVDMIFVQVNPNEDPREVAEQLTRDFARYRDVEAGDEDFIIQTPEDLLAAFGVILDIVQLVLVGIAAISLFVGSIGIMNTMYTSVVERKKEIGIMKAIGARNSDIRNLFLIESGVLGFVGGALGVIIGVSLAKLVEIVSLAALGKTFLVAYLSWELFVIALALSTLVGALAGTLPAIQASRQQPVETLRDE